MLPGAEFLDPEQQAVAWKALAAEQLSLLPNERAIYWRVPPHDRGRFASGQLASCVMCDSI